MQIVRNQLEQLVKCTLGSNPIINSLASLILASNCNSFLLETNKRSENKKKYKKTYFTFLIFVYCGNPLQ